MFSEAINSYLHALDIFTENCRGDINENLEASLRQGASKMLLFESSCEKAMQMLSRGEDKRNVLSKHLNEIMARTSSSLPSEMLKSWKPDVNLELGTLNSRRTYNSHKSPQNEKRSDVPNYPRGEEATSLRKHTMDEKDQEAIRDFQAAFHSVKAIEDKLRETEKVLSSVSETQNNMRSLFEANGQFEKMRVVGATELQQLESKLRTATLIRDKAKAVEADFHNPNLFYFVSGDYFVAQTVCDSIQQDLKEFNDFWHGSSDKVKELLERVDVVSEQCKKLDSRNSRLSREHSALSDEAKAFLHKANSEVESLSSQLQYARGARDNRDSALKNIQRCVNEIANALSILAGKKASEFVSSRDLGEGRSLSKLAQGVEPQAIFTKAISACRKALADLCPKCRMRQPRLEELCKDDINTTMVFPKHIICAETKTGALGGGDLFLPYSLKFPFEKPIEFGDAAGIASFLVRLLYALPVGKLQIHAIDHKSAGENIGVLNALCELNGQLRIVTSADEITPLLRKLDDLMGEMTRSVFTYKEKNWAEYNANHPESLLPLRVVPIYSLHGFSTTQLDMLQKLLENGPRFGIICLLADSAAEDLDERLQERFDELEFDNDRIEEDGTRINRYKHLALVLASQSIPTQRIGALAEFYAKEYRELSKKPTREIKFLSLFDDIDMWQGNTTEGISTTIGWDAAGNPVNFEFGIGRCASAYHALVGGTTGSGKSVFLHTLIQSLAGKYSPEELQFYLLDYKKGDEFKKYADTKGNAWLPHVKMISRHKDPRFALELFDFLDKEFKRRSDQFGNYGDIVAYRKNGGKIPRIIVIIDEFQVMFEEYCGLNLSDEVAKRLSTVFKQGRSYGIHLVLATQSLASLHFSGMAGILGQIGLRIALKGMASDGILADGNKAAESIIPKRQCVVNPAFGLKDSDGTVNNIVTDVPFSDPAQVEDCKKLRMLIEQKAQTLHLKSKCRVFNGAELPAMPDADVVTESLRSEKWNTFFTLLLGARTDFASTPFAVDFTEEQREHLIVAGEDGNLSSDSEVRISGEDVWNGIRRGIMRSLRSLRSCEVLYYNPAVGEVPRDVPDYFICLSGRAKEKDLLNAFYELEASKSEKKIVMVENFQDARLLHPGDAPRASFSSRPAEPQPETSRTIFASLFNGTEDPKYHVIVMTKNFGFMSKEVLARSGAEANILKGCAKRVAFNLSDDDLTTMIPHQKISDRRGPRRVWFEDMRTGKVLDFLPFNI